MKREISIYDLKVGSVLAEDIKSRDGHILISKGVVLNENHLARLKQWFSSTDYKILVDVSEDFITEEISPKEKIEQLQSKTIDFINNIFSIDMENLDSVLNSTDLIIFNICEDLKTISDLPDDVIKIVYDDKPGSHYFRVTRMAVALASIYNQDKPRASQINLNSICLASLLHDFGKRYKNDFNGFKALTFDHSTLQGTGISPNSIGTSYDDKLHSVYSYVALKGKVPENIRKTILYCNYSSSKGLMNVNQESSAANIISLCDTYDTLLEVVMKTNISSPFENVIPYMEQLVYNGQLNREIYKLFIHHFSIYPCGTKVILSNGKEAVVVSESKEFPTKPTVLVMEGVSTSLVDLAETTNITITKVVQDSKNVDNKVSDIQSKQLQSSSIPVDSGYFEPSGDATRTLELQEHKTDDTEVLDEQIKKFFRKY